MRGKWDYFFKFSPEPNTGDFCICRKLGDREWGGTGNSEIRDSLQFPSTHYLVTGELILSKNVLSSLMCALIAGQIPSERS